MAADWQDAGSPDQKLQSTHVEQEVVLLLPVGLCVSTFVRSQSQLRVKVV